MNKSNTILTVVAALVIGFAVGYLVGSDGAATKGGGVADEVGAEEAKNYPTVAKGLVGNSFHGPESAKVTLIEVSDFQ